MIVINLAIIIVILIIIINSTMTISSLYCRI